MANLSDPHRNDDEGDDLIMVSFFLVISFVALWFIAGVYIGRPFDILALDAICGVGILAALLGAYASLSIRLHRIERHLAQGRHTQEANRYPPFEFDDELFDPGCVGNRSSRANPVLW